MAVVVVVALATVTVPAAAELQSKPAAADPACAERATVCFTKKPPPGAKPTKLPSDAGTNAVFCVQDTWTFDRFSACKLERGWLEIYRVVCEGGFCWRQTTGWLEIVTRYASRAFYNNKEWNLHVQVKAITAIGTGDNGVDVSAGYHCEGTCSASHQGFPEQRLKVGQPVAGTGRFETWIDSSGQFRYGHGGVTITFNNPSDGAPGTLSETVGPETRCDWRFSAIGCVFHDTWPTFGVASWLHPSAAHHIARAQASELVGHDVPLTRTEDPQKQKDNRDIACPEGLPRPSGRSCDEYPFASTREGAAMLGEDLGPLSGRTFTDCEMPLPQGKEGVLDGVSGPLGWSACMIMKDDNWEAGTDLGNFYRENRVIDGDKFYVEVD